MNALRRLWRHGSAFLSISYLPVITLCGVDPNPQPGAKPQLGKKPWEFFPPLHEAEGRRPFAIHFPRPPYPEDAKKKHQEGTMLLEVRVRADGGVGAVDVVRSTGHSALDRAAMHTLKKWRFKPGCADRLRTVVTYSLHCPNP